MHSALAPGPNLGRPGYFDLDKYLEVVDMMINSDEVILALHMLDNPPGWYRANPPEKLTKTRELLLSRIFDTKAYIDCDTPLPASEMEDTIMTDVCFPRADILAREIKILNQKIQIPWVYEWSCGAGWLPVGLQKHGHRFDYCAQSLNIDTLKHIKSMVNYWHEKPEDTNQVKMFVAYEILEHLWNPLDMEISYQRLGIKFDMIFLSTPNCCWASGMNNWQERSLGHLRTWTSKEFMDFAQKSFKNFNWVIEDQHHTLVLKGFSHEYSKRVPT